MKKLLVVGIFVIAGISFANMHGYMHSNVNGYDKVNSGMMMGSNGMGRGMMGGGMMMNNITPELRKEMQDDMIRIQEKQLEISKTLNTTNPDMKKVERLQNEIIAIRVNHMTKLQQNITKTN